MARRGGVYVYRTRKPYALVGLPLIGRHTGYVGETSSFTRRDAQHLKGGGQYNSVAKPWADLAPKVYRLPLPDAVWLRRLVEAVLIWLLCPVYNVKGQPVWNVRRVTLKGAKRQRAWRDQLGFTAKLAGTLIRWTLVLVVAWAAWVVLR